MTCWGLGINGQLGLGHSDAIGDDELPSADNLVPLAHPPTQVVAGRDHSCALLTTGEVTCWGRANWGQLGYGNTRNVGDDESVASVGSVSLGAPATQLSAGWYHTCAIVAGGGVRCWGYGYTGQLGYGDDENIGDNETPASVGNVNLGVPAVSLDAGLYHTCAVLDGQRVRCWGYGVSGRLGYANTANLGDDEPLSEVGDVDVGGEVVGIAAGYSRTCAVLVDGLVRCWGSGARGALGRGDGDTIGDDEAADTAGPVALGGLAVQVVAGGEHTCALLDTGKVRCWRSGSAGVLGYGSSDTIGDNEVPEKVENVPLGGTAVSLSAGRYHNCALLDSGKVRCWAMASTVNLATETPR